MSSLVDILFVSCFLSMNVFRAEIQFFVSSRCHLAYEICSLCYFDILNKQSSLVLVKHIQVPFKLCFQSMEHSVLHASIK